MIPFFSVENTPKRLIEDQKIAATALQHVMTGCARRIDEIARDHGRRLQQRWIDAEAIRSSISETPGNWSPYQAALDYATDAWERAIITLDTLRERGNNDIAHEAAGTPPVLAYDNEVVIDGHDLPWPVNYLLLKIIPIQGVEIFDWKRPYLIIDPRAGHGAGIGGFKPDSQVGVALRDGHPVYFLVFRPHPEPNQTLADVMRAEATFVSEIRGRHPKAPKPIIVGNCQGGWATMILAAANPDITGPLVINGAPLAYWSGHLGENPMRYFGGLYGGALGSWIRRI
jgi:hypothetical protein